MQEDVYEMMFQVEDRHWWYTAKQQIVLNLLARYLPPRSNGTKPKIADLGCGCGAMLSRLQNDYDAVGVDGSPHAISFCAKRGVRAELGQLGGQTNLPPEHFDAVLLLDVLEHLEHDKVTVEQATSLLRPGGIMICSSPAYQWLWTYWDKLHHHYRRYTRGEFGRLFESPALKMELLSYANTVLFPVAMTVRIFQHFSQPIDHKADMQVPMAPVNWALRTIYAGERHALGRLPMPFGLSVVAVARRV